MPEKAPAPAQARTLPPDYEERVYAGVLGKLIGVYLGRPFEGWSYERIKKELGEITYYVHERLGKRLVVTDDDISGTFTFVRALEDFAASPHLSAAQIGQTWLNYILEHRTILWWGGMGTSTEHTAFQRLKRGIPAPRSGSSELNGRVVAEQIGAQIFIDGWALVAPGDPELAARLAGEAGRVSHDGEAVFAAQALAAMEAQAFVERDLEKLFATAARFYPQDCTIRRLTDDVRGWREADRDWEKTRARIQERYGYEKFGGGCHVVPNHAVIVLALVYGRDDFQESLLIANTAGWDTDCNSGNVGCLLGIKNGLAGLENGPDWRGPVADRLLLPSADGGGCVTDAVRETYSLCRLGRRLARAVAAEPKGGARFHFDLPGAVQGFRFEESPECKCVGTLWNAAGHSQKGRRSLAIGYCHLAPGRFARAATPTFYTPKDAEMGTYSMVACPTLYSGQTLRARLEADASNGAAVRARLFVRGAEPPEAPVRWENPAVTLEPGRSQELAWRVPETGGHPVVAVGVELASDRRADGVVYLDYLTWDGAPEVTFRKPEGSGTFWQRAWVEAVDRLGFASEPQMFRLSQAEGVGMAIQGTREWADYRVSAAAIPHLIVSAGLAACVQGLKRYYALLLVREGKLQLVKEYYGRQVLGEVKFPWSYDRPVELALKTQGARLTAWADGREVLRTEDPAEPLLSGAVGLVCEEGRCDFGPVKVEPA